MEGVEVSSYLDTMQIIGADRILHAPDGTTDLSFHFLKPNTEFECIPESIYLNRLGIQDGTCGENRLQLEEIAWNQYIQNIRPLFNFDKPVHVSGVFSKNILEDVRVHYRERGWYDSISGVYSPDVNRTVTLSADIANLLYSPYRKPKVMLSQ